ncbi:MAG TPA: TlpA disulfide reductase family protein [Candidatus Limnocylindrales bacterium]|nr:TlpA disulfide reductase family protein [Candidatus Limnocylindrales bacterium]
MRIPPALALGALLLASCSLQQDVSGAAPSGRVGSPAPRLSGPTVDGKSIAVDFRNARTVLVFWAAWCGPCRNEQPGLDRIAQDFKAQGVRLYGVDMLDHDRTLASAFQDEFKVPYPSVYDSAGSVTASFQVDYPPSILLIDQRGIIVARYPGEASETQLRTLIQQKLLS